MQYKNCSWFFFPKASEDNLHLNIYIRLVRVHPQFLMVNLLRGYTREFVVLGDKENAKVGNLNGFNKGTYGESNLRDCFFRLFGYPQVFHNGILSYFFSHSGVDFCVRCIACRCRLIEYTNIQYSSFIYIPILYLSVYPIYWRKKTEVSVWNINSNPILRIIVHPHHALAHCHWSRISLISINYLLLLVAFVVCLFVYFGHKLSSRWSNICTLWLFASARSRGHLT